MTKEQAIKNLLEIVELSKDEIKNENKNINAILDYEDLKSLQTVLNMLKEKDAEIEKKEKIIDLMTEMIDELSEYYTRYWGKNNEFCKEDCIRKDVDCKECIKQYFERKSKE